MSESCFTEGGGRRRGSERLHCVFKRESVSVRAREGRDLFALQKPGRSGSAAAWIARAHGEAESSARRRLTPSSTAAAIR